MGEHLDKFMASAEAGARQRVISGCAKGNDLQKNAALYEIKRLQADNKALQRDIARHLDTIADVREERNKLGQMFAGQRDCLIAESEHKAELKADLDTAHKEALSIAVALHKRHYFDVKQWEPLPDVAGLLSQIDNMTAGLLNDYSAKAKALDAVHGLVDAVVESKNAICASPVLSDDLRGLPVLRKTIDALSAYRRKGK